MAAIKHNAINAETTPTALLAPLLGKTIYSNFLAMNKMLT
jgi:hypothetical protein